MSDERHNILPFPAKHVGKMIEEASELSPDLAEALRDTQSYLDNMTTKNAPPSPKKTDNKPTSAEGSKPKKGEKSKSAKAAPKAASPDSLDLEIERQIEAMPDARNKGKEQPAKQVTKEPAKQVAKEPAKAKPKSPVRSNASASSSSYIFSLNRSEAERNVSTRKSSRTTTARTPSVSRRRFSRKTP